MDSDRELDILLQQDVVYVQGFDFAGELHKDNFSNALREIAALRAYQKQKGSAKPYGVLAYRGIVVGPEAIWNDPNYAGFWLTDDAGTFHTGVWDFRNASARQYYIDDVHTLRQDSLVNGLFIDTGDAVCMNYNLTVKSRQDIFKSTARMWRDLSNEFNRGGREFIVTPSLKNHFGVDPNGDDGKPMCNDSTPMNISCAPYGEEQIFEMMGSALWGPHRQFNIPSRDFGKNAEGCASAVRTVMEEAKRGPMFITCNACNHSTVDGVAMFHASLASFLIGAQPGSYFGAGVHFHAPLWDYQWPELQRPIGKPLGDVVQEGFIFARQFEHVSVQMNCSSQEGFLEWRTHQVALVV